MKQKIIILLFLVAQFPMLNFERSTLGIEQLRIIG